MLSDKLHYVAQKIKAIVVLCLFGIPILALAEGGEGLWSDLNTYANEVYTEDVMGFPHPGNISDLEAGIKFIYQKISQKEKAKGLPLSLPVFTCSNDGHLDAMSLWFPIPGQGGLNTTDPRIDSTAKTPIRLKRKSDGSYELQSPRATLAINQSGNITSQDVPPVWEKKKKSFLLHYFYGLPNLAEQCCADETKVCIIHVNNQNQIIDHVIRDFQVGKKAGGDSGATK